MKTKDNTPNYIHPLRVLLCTGFHRSATSATANYLLNAGLDMGENLMGSHISNVKGHFEDWDAVLLHDEQLINNGTNWQFHDHCNLRPNSNFLSGYVKQRFNLNQHWGVKDPRACLFLNEWKTTLGDTGAYLLIARHWSSCIESLLHRHSRDIASNLPDLNYVNDAFLFWSQPELAAKMWLSYNQRLLDFAKENPQQTLIITQRALFQGAPIISTLNEKFNFKLNESVNSPFDSSLFRDKASSSIFSQLSMSLQARLDSLWEQLLDLAEFKSEDESPVVIEDKDDIQIIDSISQSISTLYKNEPHLLSKHSHVDSSDISLRWKVDYVNIEDPTLMCTFLESSGTHQLSVFPPSEWLITLNDKFSLNGEVLLSAAKLLMRLKEYVLAINYFQKAISVGTYYPYLDMMIGQCHQLLMQYKDAEFFLLKAIKGNPNNPLFYTRYGEYFLEMGFIEKAATQFQVGYEKGFNNVICALRYVEFLEKQYEIDNAINIAEQFVRTNKNPELLSILARLTLQRDVVSGMQHHKSLTKENLKGKDTAAWLTKSCSFIDSAAAEKDFIRRCLGHWNYLNEA